ncbi:MAG: alkaline phosphatase [Synergistaceae bacterium]|jgi:alkaline phosphatase|nr:alkaline phosphatase [Synergistaceae bacterium]
MLFRRVLLAALGMSLLFANAAMAAAELVVLPIDRAKFLAGQKFDMEMEMMNGGTALITTSGYDSLVTDSANSASAYATGHKSVVNAMGVYENSDPDPLTHPKVENITELVKRVRRMSVGVVTTSNITDATIANVNRAPRGTLYAGNIPANESQEVHTADDVPLSASGPGSDYFKGVMDNTEVFYGMVGALGLDPTK